MAQITTSHASQVVLAASTPAQARVSQFTGRPQGTPLSGPPAPAWFYSALAWLDKSYFDANNVSQSFGTRLVGSDVDPYSALGSTRLFVIEKIRESYFRLSLADDAIGTAPLNAGKMYPDSDEGIRQMYLDLSASAIFARVRRCYIPGRLGPDLNPDPAARLESGYDPQTGMRVVVLGSAVSQIVPLDEFLKVRNEQVYDDSPAIVPLVSALVYDVTHYNEIGAKTFLLPAYYGRDQVSPGRHYVNRQQASGDVDGRAGVFGQTATFPGGPGYSDPDASELKLQSTTNVSGVGHTFTTYTYETAKVTTIATLTPRVVTGVMSFTYSAASPREAFAGQRILGFYRDAAWATSLGIPIYDFDKTNDAFKAAAAELEVPVLVYDPTHPFLNGGGLQSVVQKLLQARYLYSTERLLQILDIAISAREGARGLPVTTAKLDFDMSATPSGAVIEELHVPMLATVTTTPQAVAVPRRADAARAAPAAAPRARRGAAAAAPRLVSQPVALTRPLEVIGIGRNAPTQPQQSPTSVQLAIDAFVPREALDGTGIRSLESGTMFDAQSLGAGSEFKARATGVTLNLAARSKPALAPFDLSLPASGASLVSGTRYVVSLNGKALTVRGADGNSQNVTLAAGPDAGHTFVGAFVHDADEQTVRLYPKLALTLPAPSVGSHGIVQGESYGVRLTYGGAKSSYDVLDADQAAVATAVAVPNPKATDKSTPHQGDLYFGSFIGGADHMSVWSVPIFATVKAADLSGAPFDGTMSIAAQTSGLPGYKLQITDSSLYVYSGIDVDTGAVGTTSVANVFLASATINASPDEISPRAFLPCRLFMGLARLMRMGTTDRFAFVPSDDSIIIGGKRYMVSVIAMAARDDDPNARPYPPVFWPQTRFWQFANRHDPYLAVRYDGASQEARTAEAEADAARIGLATATRREPMHMYLDTNPKAMRIWPIFPFPLEPRGQGIDRGQLSQITDTVLSILSNSMSSLTMQREVPGVLDDERVSVPDSLMQENPYVVSLAATANLTQEAGGFVSMSVAEPVIAGRQVKMLSPGLSADLSVDTSAGKDSQRVMQSEKVAAGMATLRSGSMTAAVAQERSFAVAAPTQTMATSGQFHPVYGFSVVNPENGEAFIVEVIARDLEIPDQLPRPTINKTYNPYYVRVVFVNRLTCYNMTIIVPSMVHDQYGHFATLGTPYKNLLSKTNELKLGYLYTLYDTANNFDDLTFLPYSVEFARSAVGSHRFLFTNLPYRLEQQEASFSPLSLFQRLPAGRGERFDTSFVSYERPPVPPEYFVCRRLNWNADCHLMQATHEDGSAVHLAFGAGDIVPFRLDADFAIDKRFPAHMYKLTHTFSDLQYDSVRTLSVANKPYVVAVATQNGVPRYVNFSINATAGTADLEISKNVPLRFPSECYVVGQASPTLTSIDTINATLGTALSDTGNFLALDAGGNPLPTQQFEVVTYNSLVYLIRSVSNVPALGVVGGATSGLLIDTFVPATTGNLALAQGARHKRSGLAFFGESYTPTTMADTLDTLDFASITGETFFAPTIFIPIPELDASKGLIANLSNFLGQQVWTFIYPEVVADAGETVNGVAYPNGLNIDAQGKPVLSLQKLQFVYDAMVVLFTPNDLAHKYPLLPKQRVLALSNDQIREGICWRSANVQPHRLPPTNICAQQVLPEGDGMDRPNIIYSPHNRPVTTSLGKGYMGMSVASFRSLSGVVYSIEESAMAADQTGTGFVSQVSSTANMLVGVLFDYDNNDLGTLTRPDRGETTKGIVFLNGYLGAGGYQFSSPDHFDVNDVLPSQVPLLEQVTGAMGEHWDVAFYNTDVSLPRQFWSMTYDGITGPGLSNFIADAPPPPADPEFRNRTRSLILSLQNPVHPVQLGLLDTYSSVVAASLHLRNGVTGAVFLSKKADRDIASIGSNPPAGPNTFPLYGLPTKYDFFIFSRDHYWTLKGASFELIDQGYAMSLIDDGSGTGTKVAKYYIDNDGNYYELFNYVLYSPNGGILENKSITLKVNLGNPAHVDPNDLASAINRTSSLIYAAFGPAQPGQPPAIIPIQAVGGTSGAQAAPIGGTPGFNGYRLNVMTASQQPMQISQLCVGATVYAIAGPTTIVPRDARTGEPLPFLGSLSHGLDRQLSVPLLQSKDLTSFIPRTTVPAGPTSGLYGGNGLGSLIATQFSAAFQGSGAVPPAIAANPAPGSTMPADDTVFYTFNAISNVVMDSRGRAVAASGGQYFVDSSDADDPIYAVVTLPRFRLNGNDYWVNLASTLSDGITSRYSLIVGGKSYLFGPDNAHVTVDRTRFTFNPLNGGVYTVSYAAVDAPAGDQAPSPVVITPFSITAGGKATTIDVFNNAGGLANALLGVLGRQYSYDPVRATVTVHEGPASTTVPLKTGLTFASASGYGYVIGFENGGYTVNGSAMYPYSASTAGAPASHALMTAPQMFTLDGNFYTFDRDADGDYVSVTGDGAVIPINSRQFSILGRVYIINDHVQPHAVIGGGNVYPMTPDNTQFVLNGVQYTLDGHNLSGQFNLSQGNVVVIENTVYQLDTLNGRIVGNGNAYPLTTSGFTYTITTRDKSFTVTTEPNATTVTIGNVDYLINNSTVVGDGITYPILPYRTFVDGAQTFTIGFDGTASIAPPLALSGSAPFVQSTFGDGPDVYTVNDVGAFDGTSYFRLSGTPPQFTAGAETYTLRNDAVAIAAGPSRTILVDASGPLNPKQFAFGTKTIFFGRPQDVAAFDGTRYFGIANNQFTDTNTGLTWTISGNTAVNAGNSYEIFSNLGEGAYFEVPGGPTYYVNIQVADTGSATGDIFNVFPIASNRFAMPIAYTITVAGAVATVDAITFTGGPTVVATLTAAAGALTGGFFEDPVTRIVYTCVIDSGHVTFVDSNNAVYPYPAAGTANQLVASLAISAKFTVAVDTAANVFPIVHGQFIAGAATYTVNVPIAYANPAGPFFAMVNGRFIVPRAAPLSSLAYTVSGGRVVKGFVVSNDDQFSVDGNIVYTVNATTVVRASNQGTLAGAPPNQTLTVSGRTYALDSAAATASIQPAGLNYDNVAKTFTVSLNGVAVTYSVAAAKAQDNRNPSNNFGATVVGSQVTFTDDIAGVTYTFDRSGNNPITVRFPYRNQFFIDALNGATFYIDVAGNKVEALTYLPETTQYAFMPADGNIYLIHYSDVGVVFPVVSGPNVNAGVATVGSDIFTVHVDEVDPVGGGAPVPVNANSFEINGNLYSITGSPAGADYSACHVVGAGMAPVLFLSANTFKLTDPAVTYTLHLDAANLPATITADFAVKPSRNLISINDDVFIVSYNTVTTGTLQGQGQAAIAISDSRFTLGNRFDSTKAKFIFANLNIFNAASVVGQFTVNGIPTFFLGSSTFTLDPVALVLTDNDKRPYPLLPNPTMFSINGHNYVIDSNRVPHAIIGNDNISPLATDVTVEAGEPIPNSTFTLNGQIYKYTEDAAHNLLAITGTKSYMVAQPGLTFALDSSLIFTIHVGAPAAGNFAGTTVPIGTITTGSLTLNLYAGVPESGGDDYFTYKNVLYTLVKSGATYLAVQKSYAVYCAHPVAGQLQLAVFDSDGTTYMVTDGTTTGVGPAAGINPGSLWAQTATTATETQFGLVYGLEPQPTTVTRSATGVFQFQATDPAGDNALYDIVYTAGGNANLVKIDVPNLLPTFMQTAGFTFTQSYPLTFETGGYNAFTTFVAETATPSESFAGSYKTPVISSDTKIDTLLGEQGDFTLEFWHSIPVSEPGPYNPVTYRASSTTPLVYNLAIDFENSADIFLAVNNTVMRATTTPPVFSSGWRHVALSYTQPYVMLCKGAGFEVKKGSSYDFSRDFSIAMTFAATDVSNGQGLLYKGTGSDVTSPELRMSYRVTISGGKVKLELTDGSGTVAGPFEGPTIQAGRFYQVIIVKRADTVAAAAGGSSDPFSLPIDIKDLVPAQAGGAKAHLAGLPSSGDGDITFSNMETPGAPNIKAVVDATQNGQPKSYTVTISVRVVNDDGTFGAWVSHPNPHTITSDAEMAVNATGTAHLLIGAAYDDVGRAVPLGDSASSTGNIRDVYLFNSAIDHKGIKSNAGVLDIASAGAEDLAKSGLVGFWHARYDANGVIANPFDPEAVAISSNTSLAYLAPLTGHELEATALYVNGAPIHLKLVDWSDAPSSMQPYSAGAPWLSFNAGGLYKLEEISLWRMARQSYQVIDDMFGRLVPTNEPYLIVYLSGAFLVQDINAPILPMNKYIDHIEVHNPIASMDLAFSPASIDLTGSPAVARCGPLITPNLYTPPGVALTVCDTVPGLTTYSVTLNSVTGTLAGEVNEVYVYIKDHVLTLYAGKKVGDLVLSWVSQEQGDVQLIGYAEGAPPAPMANLTNKGSYAGATSVSFTAPASVTLTYEKGIDHSHQTSITLGDNFGVDLVLGAAIHPFGLGLSIPNGVIKLELSAGYEHAWNNSDQDKTGSSAENKIEESFKYSVKLDGTLLPVTGDSFMANLNSLSLPSTTPGAPGSKTAILPNPSLGGFTTSNPAATLPKVTSDERFGSRMFQPSPYGQAFVTSTTLDVYQQTLVQSNTVYGFVRVPNAQIPRDINIVSFRMSSKYLRPGVLDGMVGYAYNPAKLATGVETYATSTGQMAPVYDKNFSSGEVGHNASYMRIVEAYRVKKEIDQKTFNAIAQYQSAYSAQGVPNDERLLPALDFYNEYVWSSKGATEEVKHSYSTSYKEVYTTSTVSANVNGFTFNGKLTGGGITMLDLKFSYKDTSTDTTTYSYHTNGTSSFDISASFEGIDGDTQMRYESNNDAHFVMNFNSMYNQNNQSGLNLVIGSDGLVYNIVTSVSSGAGIPRSDNIDDSFDYMQPQPSYTAGNANGISGALEPYDRPGKTKLFRTYAFFRQASKENADEFWNTVVDPVWLANSEESDARALRTAKHDSQPWRLMYRVTYSERFLPPISTATFDVPQITPVMAVPVLDRASDFLFTPIGQPRPANNPLNDLEANIVLAAPTVSGASAGSPGPVAGTTVLPNNVIPFDVVSAASSIVNWGDSNNAQVLARLLLSALGLNTVRMSSSVPLGATKVSDVKNPASGSTLYTIYRDANGITLNVPINPAITVYQDVNGNPVQYYDGKTFQSLQADYVASTDGSVMYYIQPPSTYDQSAFDLTGDYDLFGHPGDEWRYFLVSGMSSNMTSGATVTDVGPFFSSTGATPYTGFSIATAQHAADGTRQVQGYVLVKGVLQWPHLNTQAEAFADVQVYKAMSLLDTFPIGDPQVLMSFMKAQYPAAPFVENEEINLVFARNIVSNFNLLQQALLPQ